MSDMIPVYVVPETVKACGQVSFIMRPTDAGDTELVAAADNICKKLYNPESLAEYGIDAASVLSGEVSEDELAFFVMNHAQSLDPDHDVSISEVITMPTEGQVLVLGYVAYPDGVDQWGDD